MTDKPLFSLGQTVATPGALETLQRLNVEPSTLLDRHISGDWSDMDKEDQKANKRAVESGEDRVFSAYLLPPDNTKVYVITEWDRSYTTILLPSEY
jgi:hypothetical protein